MRHYELMVILDPDLEERTIAPSLDAFLNVVRNGGGSVERVDVWGRRRLSFEIDKKAEGIYAVIDLTAEPATMKELDRQLNLNESIMRTKVMRPELRASKAVPAKPGTEPAKVPAGVGAASTGGSASSGGPAAVAAAPAAEAPASEAPAAEAPAAEAPAAEAPAAEAPAATDES